MVSFKKIARVGSLSAFAGSVLFPAIVMAAGPIGSFDELLEKIRFYLKLIVPILVSVAVVAFLVGVVIYIWKADDEEERKTGRRYMLYGIIGLAVITSLWGLVRILTGTFGFPNPTVPKIPDTAGQQL